MKRIVGIETSCDETAAAVVEWDERFEIRSNIIASQIPLHQKYGGVVPEIASRTHIECISQVVDEALTNAQVSFADIDAIAVTYAPGLVGALLVGVNYAKSLAAALSKPLVAVHHIEGHICANFLAHEELKPPFTCLVASGGHSTIVVVQDETTYRIAARTRDDAAGEAFDKIARVLGLGYPGGPAIQKAAQNGDPNAFSFPQVSFDGSADFSFSGVKTAVINMLHQMEQKKQPIPVADVAASFQMAVCDVLARRLIAVAKQSGTNSVALAGGVAANALLRELVQKYADESGLTLYYPPLVLCTDNAAMVAARGLFSLQRGETAGSELNAMATKELGKSSSV